MKNAGKRKRNALRLRQQIFLITFAFLLLTGGSIALLTQSDSFSALVERERENAVALHGYLASDLRGTILRERLAEGCLRLSEAQVASLLQEQLGTSSASEHTGFSAVCVLKEDAKRVAGSLPQADTADVLAKTKQTDGCVAVICDGENGTYLLIASALQLENCRYSLLTATDLTLLYDSRQERSDRALWLSGWLALGLSLVLLLVIRLIFRPFDRVNRALKQIAGGEYTKRIPVTGSEEFRVLSENVNSMAQAIKASSGQLRRTADSRKRFADNMAHEMKTPLTSILCMADLLRIKRSVSDSERREYAGVIVEEAKRMKALSTKLLTLASADSSAPDLRACSLPELIGEVEQAIRPVLAQNGIRLTVAGEEVTVYTDRQLLQTLLINLIDNAAKASAEGKQVLVCHTVREDSVLIAVIDEGIGMTKEELLHAKEAFWMADKSRSRKAGGAGLGLSLCEEIARVHHGSLSITSEPGKGTTVCLTLPRKAPKEVRT